MFCSADLAEGGWDLLIRFLIRRPAHFILLLTTIVLAGCHSHYVQATITNQSGSTLNVIQVDYPSASFGTQQLAPDAAFHYRFKLLGSGPIKLTYIDSHNQEHSQTGPSLNEGQEGQLRIVIDAQKNAEFQTSLTP